VKKDVLVKHKTYGTGKVSGLKKGYIFIVFEVGEKSFEFPSAFEKGFLSSLSTAAITTADSLQSSLEANALKSSKDLIQKFVDKQFTYIDNRATSGILWVIYSENKKTIFEEIVSGYNISYKLEKRGAVATGNIPAWRIMFN